MPLTPDQIEQLAAQPQSVTIDGDSATAAPAAELLTLLRYANAQRAIAAGKPSMRCFKLIPPGSISGWSGTPRIY